MVQSADDGAPLVSVVTATYNHENYIGPCIESLLRQTYPNWEQIIIDDGSTDATPKVIRQYSDPRIRYHRQTNQGAYALARTYNRALDLAKGSLVAILEGDDLWPPKKLATLVPTFGDPRVVLAYGQNADVSAYGQMQGRMSRTARLRQKLPRSALFNDPVGCATRHMLVAERASMVMPATVVIRRAALEDIGGFQYVAGLPLTDYPTFLELSLKGKFFFTPETMGYRRFHLESVTAAHGETIFEIESQYVWKFLERHSAEFSLEHSRRVEMEKSWIQCRNGLAFSNGRVLLSRGQWREARAAFRSALKSKRPAVTLASLAGYISACLHFDIEPLMKLSGRPDPRTGTIE